MPEETHVTRYQSFFYFAILLALVVLTFAMMQSYITVLVLGAAAAIIIYPLYEKLVIKLKGFRGLAAVIVILCLILIVAAIIAFVGTNLFNEAAGLYQGMQSGGGGYDSVITSIQDKINKIVPAQLSVNIRSYLSFASGWVLSHTGSFFTNTFDFAVKAFLACISIFYLLKDGPHIVATIKRASPLPALYNESIATALERTINSILLGSITVALVQGAISGLGYAIFGVPNPILLAIITALAALLPTVGTAVIIIPCVIFLFATGHTGPAIGLLIWGSTAVGLIDNLLSPKLIGRGVKVHPLLILFSVLGGLSFFGPEGFLIGPLVLSLLFTFLDMYHVFNRYEKSL